MDNQIILENIKNIPVTISVSMVLIVIFFLYNLNILTALPCGRNIYNIFATSFTHVNISHLLSNLIAFYALSRVEVEMGKKSFIWLLVFLITFNTIVEYIVRNVWKNIKCSIGFSGILFGITTWEIILEKNITIEVIVAIIAMVIGPSLQGGNLSLEGHAIGAISGIIGGLLWSMI